LYICVPGIIGSPSARQISGTYVNPAYRVPHEPYQRQTSTYRIKTKGNFSTKHRSKWQGNSHRFNSLSWPTFDYIVTKLVKRTGKFRPRLLDTIHERRRPTCIKPLDKGGRRGKLVNLRPRQSVSLSVCRFVILSASQLGSCLMLISFLGLSPNCLPVGS